MKINNKSKLATMAMIFIASSAQKDGMPITLAAVVHAINSSTSYTEQIFKSLIGAGLLKSFRGPGGGYEIVSISTSVFDIVTAINAGDAGKRKADKEFTSNRWSYIDKRIGDELKKITIGVLI